MKLLYVLVPLMGVASATPAEPVNNAGFCKIVTKLVTIAKAQAAATAYCSSYLSIPAGETVLVYPSVSTLGLGGPPNVQRGACRTPAPEIIKLNVPRDPSPNSGNPKKLVQKPACFNSYSAAAKISSACSCLSITPAVASVTTDVFKIVASGAPRRGLYADTQQTGAVPSLVFDQPSASLAPAFRIGPYSDRMDSALIIQDGTSDVAYLGDCSISSRTVCNADNVMIGQPREVENYEGELPLGCFVRRGDRETCLLECIIDNGNNDNEIGEQGHWRVIDDGTRRDRMILVAP